MDELELFRRLSRCEDKEQMNRCIEEFEASKRTVTNADRIREMSDAELAAFLADDDRVCPPVHTNCSRFIHDCVGCHLAWLQMPAKED